MYNATITVDPTQRKRLLPRHWLGGNEVNSSYNMLRLTTDVCREHGLKHLVWRSFQKDDQGYDWKTGTYNQRDWRRQKRWTFFAGDSTEGWTDDIDQEMALHARFHTVSDGNRWVVNYFDAETFGHSIQLKVNGGHAYRRIPCQPIREGWVRFAYKTQFPVSLGAFVLKDGSEHPFETVYNTREWTVHQEAFAFDVDIEYLKWGVHKATADAGVVSLDELRVDDEPIDNDLQPYWQKNYAAYFDCNDTKATPLDIARLASTVDAKVIWCIPLKRNDPMHWKTADYYAAMCAWLDRENQYPEVIQIGNEPYFHGGWSRHVAEYGHKVVEYAQAIRDRIGDEAVINFHTDRRSNHAWLNTLLPIVKDKIGRFSIDLFHEYPYKRSSTDRHWTNIWNGYGNPYKWWIGNKGPYTAHGDKFLHGPERVREVLAEHGVPNTELVMGEFNFWPSQGRGEGNWHGDAISTANAIGAMVERGTDVCLKWSLITRDFGSGYIMQLSQPPLVELPPHFEVLKLWHQMPRTWVQCNLKTNAPVESWVFDKNNPESAFMLPGVTAWAAIDGRKTISIMVVNATGESINVSLPGYTGPIHNQYLEADHLRLDNEVKGRGERLLHWARANDGSHDPNQIRIRSERLTAGEVHLWPYSVNLLRLANAPVVEPPVLEPEPEPTPDDDALAELVERVEQLEEENNEFIQTFKDIGLIIDRTLEK